MAMERPMALDWMVHLTHLLLQRHPPLRHRPLLQQRYRALHMT